MKKHQGIWMPDREQHLIDWMNSRGGAVVDGKGTYQLRKLQLAVSYCKSHRVAVDIGAYCGLWSLQLEKQFTHVHAFEPVPEYCECFTKNLDGSEHTTLHGCALGDSHKQIRMVQYDKLSTMCAQVRDEPGDIPLQCLDDFELKEVDFIKIDCEGYELHVLKGGEVTIRENHPVIIVEQKPGLAQQFGLPEIGAVEYLQEMGYKLAEMHAGDYIMVPPK